MSSGTLGYEHSLLLIISTKCDLDERRSPMLTISIRYDFTERRSSTRPVWTVEAVHSVRSFVVAFIQAGFRYIVSMTLIQEYSSLLNL
jgi:hypothetical protein